MREEIGRRLRQIAGKREIEPRGGASRKNAAEVERGFALTQFAGSEAQSCARRVMRG